jgi:predicted transcriptional regulator
MPAKKRRDVVPILVRVPPETKKELQSVADDEHRSLTNLVERVLENFVAAKKAESGNPAGKRK